MPQAAPPLSFVPPFLSPVAVSHKLYKPNTPIAPNAVYSTGFFAGSIKSLALGHTDSRPDAQTPAHRAARRRADAHQSAYGLPLSHALPAGYRGMRPY